LFLVSQTRSSPALFLQPKPTLQVEFFLPSFLFADDVSISKPGCI
jgi:hypothetical protein